MFGISINFVSRKSSRIFNFNYMGIASSRMNSKYPVIGDESIMSPKAHGTTTGPLLSNLRWNVDPELADRICCFNRHYAENSGYFLTTSFLKEHDGKSEVTFYDSFSGKPLFVAPKNRTWEEFVKESRAHGWPSFRDEEVIWENMRCLKNGESVSVDGTHLGHNLPDSKGNRYCINLVSVAGLPYTANIDQSGEL